MKKIILVILIFLLAVSMTEAAFEKGTKSAGGRIAFTSYRGESELNPTSYSIDIWPQLSYFVLKNVSIDVSPGFGFSWGDSMNTTFLGFGVGARYFINHFYGGLFLDYNYSHGKSDEYSSKYTNKYSNLTLSLGYLFPLSRNIYLDFGVSYLKGIGKITSHSTFRFDGETFTNDTSADNEDKQWKTAFGIKIFFK